MQATMRRDSPAPAYLPSNIVECVNVLVRAVWLPPAVWNLLTDSSTGLSVSLKSHGVSLVESIVGDVAAMYPLFRGDCASDTVFVGGPSGHVFDMVLSLAALHNHALILLCLVLPPACPPACTAALGMLTCVGHVCVQYRVPLAGIYVL